MYSYSVFAILALSATVSAQPSSLKDYRIVNDPHPLISVVNQPRPLYALADQIEIRLGKAVNYEDPAYVYGPDLLDFASPEFRLANPGRQQLGVRWTSYEVFLDVAALKASPHETISALVEQYNKSGRAPALFKVITTAPDTFCIRPDKLKNESGVVRDAVSPLDTIVTIPRSTMSSDDALSAIITAVNHKLVGYKLVGPGHAWNLLIQTQVDLEANNEPARDVLTRMLRHMKHQDNRAASVVPAKSMSYRMFYDVNEKTWAINLQIVMVATPAPYGNVSELAPAP